MNKAEKCSKILKQLQDLYPSPDAPLDHSDAFSLLIAVMLSAQTTDKKVNEVTPQLFELAKTPEEMQKVPVPKILETIRQLGLAPTKARNVQKIAALLVERHDGQVPKTYPELEALPGVGHKTASVVMSQAFGEPAFPVDTHIHRLAYRWGLSNGKSVAQTEKDLKRLFPKASWNDLHLQIIFFGREYCPARGHKPQTCPICSWGGVKSRLAKES